MLAAKGGVAIMDSQAIFSMMSGVMSQGATNAGMIMGTLLLLIGVLLVWMQL
jgi:hypothetical protein